MFYIQLMTDKQMVLSTTVTALSIKNSTDTQEEMNYEGQRKNQT